MSHAEPLRKKADYYEIKEGTFRLPSSKDDPEAVLRTFTNPKTKETGTKYERAFKSLFGRIVDIKFNDNTLKDGTKLRSLNIVLDDNEGGVGTIVSLPMDSRYTADFLRKLPNIRLDEEVRLMPYDFEPDVGSRQVGISVTHRDGEGNFSEKITDFFREETKVDGQSTYKTVNGLPEATDEDKQDWPFYFKKVNKFLIKYTEDNIVPKLRGEERSQEASKEEVGPGDIPF